MLTPKKTPEPGFFKTPSSQPVSQNNSKTKPLSNTPKPSLQKRDVEDFTQKNKLKDFNIDINKLFDKSDISYL